MNLPRSLSAKYKEDFAYPTIKDRLPVILTKVIDTVHQRKAEVLKKYGENGTKDVKEIVGLLSKFRNELQTNKALLPLCDNKPDTEKWNSYIEQDRNINGTNALWYVSPWLYTECYFYRRIMQAIYLSDTLNYIDPFQDQKRNALISCTPAVTSLINFLHTNTDQLNDKDTVKRLFADFLQISLWGNKCDLSISSGVENTQKVNAEVALESLYGFILADDIDLVWDHLCKAGENAQVDIVIDNAGFELITDLVLVEFLLECKLVKGVTLHGKAMPWFVSDVTPDDFSWTLDQLKSSDNEIVQKFGIKLQHYLAEGRLTFKAEHFWTLPYDFAQMKSVDPDLYNSLSAADLVIFKGDLNYRKLIGDLKWEYNTSFKESLRGFLPTALVALRTLKCDVVVGITKELAKTTQDKDQEWMLTGRWGVLQFAN